MANMNVFYQGPGQSGNLDQMTGGQGSPSSTIEKTAMSSSPCAITYQGTPMLLYQQASQTGNLMWRTYDTVAKKWNSALLVHGVNMSNAPCAVEFQGKLWVFYNGPASGGLRYSVLNGSSWDPIDVQLSDSEMQYSPSAVNIDDEKLVVFYQGREYVAYNGITFNNVLMYRVYDAATSNWGNAYPVNGVGAAITYPDNQWAFISESPSAIVDADKNILVFFGGSDARVSYIKSQGGFSEYPYLLWEDEIWQVPDVVLTGSPNAVYDENNALSIFFQGQNQCGQLWKSVYDPVQDTWTQVNYGNGTVMSFSPSALLL